METIESRVKKVIFKNLEMKEEDLQPETLLNEDFLDQVAIVIGIEEEFALQIPNEDAENLKCMKDFVTYLKARP